MARSGCWQDEEGGGPRRTNAGCSSSSKLVYELSKLVYELSKLVYELSLAAAELDLPYECPEVVVEHEVPQGPEDQAGGEVEEYFDRPRPLAQMCQKWHAAARERNPAQTLGSPRHDQTMRAMLVQNVLVVGLSEHHPHRPNAGRDRDLRRTAQQHLPEPIPQCAHRMRKCTHRRDNTERSKEEQ